ncbi:hypothetical protein NDU88_004842 [Pleurodeles waltl]|uniref:Uncharacterized protein n=1 Tax=Pleurodeles waltl TaxID=8319 RepID=A0AAV7W644_PLEWA|nr:hypothetical protein NDU88_004842 [Pleurodeles waltl]
MTNILILGRSRELSKSRVVHAEAAFQQEIKKEPVDTVMITPTDKLKTRSKSSMTPKTCHWCCDPYPHQNTAQHTPKDVLHATNSKSLQKSKLVHVVEISDVQDDKVDMDDDDVKGTVHVIHSMQPEEYRGRCIPKCTVAVA